MKRFAVAVGLVAVFALATETALAANVHFVKGPSFSDNGTTLSATGKLAGLGNGDIFVELTATGTPTTLCTNPGGTQAPGQNPADVTVTGGQAIPSGSVKNGAVTISVSTAEPAQPTAAEAGCPNNRWTATITDIDFDTATISVYQPCSATPCPSGTLVFQQTYTV